MSNRTEQPVLSQGNRIYLYRLLKTSLGVGKQTFLPAVEKALDADHLAATDLGFSDTRALLEELGDFVNLTVFKGGRIYATIVAQPAWDEALAAESKAEKSSSKTDGKSWKRKKSKSNLKAVKPRRVPRQAAAKSPATKRETATETPTPAEKGPAPAEQTPTSTKQALAAAEPPAAIQKTTGSDAKTPDSAEPASGTAEDVTGVAEYATNEVAPTASPTKDAETSHEAEHHTTSPLTTEHISLTVLFDPSEGNAGETVDTDASRDVASAAPGATVPSSLDDDSVNTAASSKPASNNTAETGRSPQPKASPQSKADPVAEPNPQPHVDSQPATNPAPARTAVPADYPVDFAREVYCPGDLLAALTHLLPYGADVLGILSAYFDIAKLAGTYEGGRSRATFPVGYVRDGERHEVRVTIKKRSGKTAAAGQAWAVAAVEHEAD